MERVIPLQAKLLTSSLFLKRITLWISLHITAGWIQWSANGRFSYKALWFPNIALKGARLDLPICPYNPPFERISSQVK